MFLIYSVIEGVGAHGTLCGPYTYVYLWTHVYPDTNVGAAKRGVLRGPCWPENPVSESRQTPRFAALTLVRSIPRWDLLLARFLFS